MYSSYVVVIFNNDFWLQSIKHTFDHVTHEAAINSISVILVVFVITYEKNGLPLCNIMMFMPAINTLL